MTEEIHDTSHLDRYLKTRQRVSLLNASWKPALAGAAGGAIIIAAVAIAQPRFTTREVVIDHVVQRDAPFDNHIPQDKPFDNYVPRLVQPPPVATNPPKADAPKTQAERKFADKYKGATYFGRVVRSIDGRALSFADGKSFWPARWTGSDWSTDIDDSKAYISDPFIGDIAACAPVPGHADLMFCHAMHDGRETDIHAKDVDTGVQYERPSTRPQRTEFAELVRAARGRQ